MGIGLFSGFVVNSATLAGVGVGLAIGGGLALAAHAALELDRKRS